MKMTFKIYSSIEEHYGHNKYFDQVKFKND